MEATSPLVAITALHFCCGDELLVVGRGSWVTVYGITFGAALGAQQALPSAVLHGFSLRGTASPARLVLFVIINAYLSAYVAGET